MKRFANIDGVPVLVALLLALACLGVRPVIAQERDVAERLDRLEAELRELRLEIAARDSAALHEADLHAQIDAITRQLEEMSLGGEVVPSADSSRYGLGPAASKVYAVSEGVSIGGYGEMLYENFASAREDHTPAGLTDRIDFLRAITYVGYKFNERLVFNSEIEFEHSSTENRGDVSVEFAYLDYRLGDHFGIRGGLLLSPMGFINEMHEPPTFLGTRRPETERQIIPSTWRENGIGVFGEVGAFRYRAYLMNGFDGVGGGSSRAEGFEASGLREARQNGSKAQADNFAGVGRVDYVSSLGLTLGTSLYAGNSAQGRHRFADSSRTFGARTLIWEGHAQYKARGFDLRGLFALADVNDADELNRARGLTGQASIGERLVGWYVQGGYDVLRSLPTQHQLIPYVRFETLNTQNRVPLGFAADPANDRDILTLGAAFKPVPTVALKADYQVNRNEADTGVDRFNVQLGYLF